MKKSAPEKQNLAGVSHSAKQDPTSIARTRVQESILKERRKAVGVW